MANATIYTKALTGGNKKCVILEPGMELLRETNLPANWRKIRVGFMCSFTNLASGNGAPVAETVVGVLANPRTGLNFGMSNGVGFYGDVGNRFLGWGLQRGSGSNTRLMDGTTYFDVTSGGTINFTPAAQIGNGTTVVSTTGSAGSWLCRTNTPTATTLCIASCCFDFDISTGANGRITVTTNLSTDATSGANSQLSEASDLTLNGRLMAGTFSGSVAANGGWWTMDGVTPVDCRFISIRNPFQLNRLRIFNLMIQQLL